MLTTAEEAQVAYTADCIALDDLARDMAAAGKTVTAAKWRHKAKIAYRAAKAEQVNPEPAPVVPCGTCGGIRVCDWDAHRLVMA